MYSSNNVLNTRHTYIHAKKKVAEYAAYAKPSTTVTRKHCMLYPNMLITDALKKIIEVYTLYFINIYIYLYTCVYVCVCVKGILLAAEV